MAVRRAWLQDVARKHLAGILAALVTIVLVSFGLLDGLDFGRKTIVRTFRELMTPEANAYWGLLGRPTP